MLHPRLRSHSPLRSFSKSMETACEIIEVSSDEDDATTFRVPKQTGVHPGLKRKGSGCPPSGESSLDASEDSEDECAILDGMPENMVERLNYTELGGEMADEMLIVGEKGQFACRDYPHPRYLCATFLFSMTPHEKHCDMCHCYVCDCSAPCVYWARHCSSTHKEQAWRVERQYFRRIKREQHSTQQHCDVKLALAIPNRQPVSKVAQSLQLRNDESRLTHHQDPLQQIQSTILRESPHPWTDSAAPNQQVSKAAPSVPSLCDESKSARHHDHEQQIQRTIPREQPRTSTETTAPKRRPISKTVPSLSPSGKPKSLHKDPVQHTQRTIPTEPPRSCTETLTTRPKDILCEIYKNCPTVISCRRRIPPPRHSDQLSDNDQGD